MQTAEKAERPAPKDTTERMGLALADAKQTLEMLQDHESAGTPVNPDIKQNLQNAIDHFEQYTRTRTK